MDFNAKERIFGSLGAYFIEKNSELPELISFSTRMLRQPCPNFGNRFTHVDAQGMLRKLKQFYTC